MNEKSKILNPFPGIRSFEPEEDFLFFGREAQISELITNLLRSHFIAVIGSSGCGKSSLVRAGVIPSLFKHKVSKLDQEWSLSVFRPGDAPIKNFAEALYNSQINDRIEKSNQIEKEEIEKTLRNDENGLIKLIKELNNKSQKNRLIIIDQFEELFRFKQTKNDITSNEENVFVNQFLKAVESKDLPAYILLTMRSDFLDNCTEFNGLVEAINIGHYLVPRMNKKEIAHAITGPIHVFNAKLEDDLLKQLLEDVGDSPDQLPILQHALMRTWEYWQTNKIGDENIGLKHYEAIGTMTKALSMHAEEVFSELGTRENKLIAEKLFKALTDLSIDNKGTRRPTPFNDICMLVDSEEEKVKQVIDKFREPGRAFLMPAFKFELRSDTIIDISHESIMRVWFRLKQWVEEETSSAQLYLRLSNSAHLYQLGKSGLLVNPELQLALKWQEENKPNKTWAQRYDPAFDRAIQFLAYSKKEHDLEIKKREDQQKRELLRVRRFALILGGASVISILFLIVSLNLRIKAQASEKKALEKEKVALEESKKAEKQRKEAVLQKKISEQQQQIAEEQRKITEQQKQYALEQHDHAIRQRGIALYQKRKAEEQEKNALAQKKEAEKQKEIAFEQKEIADKERNKAETSEKNAQRLRKLAIARTVAIESSELQNTIKGDLPALLAYQAYKLNKENGGKKNDPDIYNALSNVTTKDPILNQHKDGVRDIVYSADRNMIISCSDDGSVIFTDLSQKDATPVSLNTMGYGKNGFRSIDVSSDSKYIVAGSSDGSILLWNIAILNPEPVVMSGHTDIVNTVKFDNTNDYFTSASSDGTIRLWKISRAASIPITIDKSNTRYLAISYSNDGSKIACASKTGQIKIFNALSIEEEPIVFSTGNSPIYCIFK